MRESRVDEQDPVTANKTEFRAEDDASSIEVIRENAAVEAEDNEGNNSTRPNTPTSSASR